MPAVAYANFGVQLSPTALQGPYGQSWQRAQGIVKDYYLQLLNQAVKMRFPDYAASDALGAIGDERSIDSGTDTTTGVTETQAAYAARVKNAWGADAVAGVNPLTGIWYWGGTAFGLLTALAAQGYVGPNVQIVQQNGTTWSLNSGGALVITSGSAFTFTSPLWNQFYVVFSPTPGSWSGGAPSANELAKLIRIINLWRPGHMICAGIYTIVSGKVWGFPATNKWGSGVWGGSYALIPVPATPPF